MNDTDKKFVDAVNNWRVGMNPQEKIKDLIDELVTSNEELDSLDHNEDDTLWNVGYDDGFASCTIIVIERLKDILNGI